MPLSRRGPSAALVIVLVLSSLPAGPTVAAGPIDSEPFTPSTLTFPAGGGWAGTNLSLDRSAHVRDARLVMRGDTIETPVPYRLNASTQAAFRANAWSGGLDDVAPDQAPDAYIATAFNATQVANVSAADGALAMSPIAANFTYQLYIFQISTLDVIELRVLWSGYALPPSMPIYWSGKLFLYNFTSLAWQMVGAYPYPLSGVQNVTFNTSYPPNFVKPGTGSVAAMVVSESTASEVFTDVFEVTGVVGVFPRPAVDVGGDASVEWGFEQPGWGALGRQYEFETGLENTFWNSPPGGGSTQTSFLVPAGANASSAHQTVRLPAESPWSNNTGTRVTVDPNSNATLNSTGVPNFSRGEEAFLTLHDVIALDKTTDGNGAQQNGSIIVGSDPSGYRAAGEWITVLTTGQLARISVFVVSVSGSPGDLRMDLEGANASGFPNGIPIGSSWVNQSLVVNGNWIDFWFNGVNLSQGVNVSIMIRAPLAPPDTATNYVQLGTSSNDSYRPGESISYFNVTSLGVAWAHVANADLNFELSQNLALATSDAPGVLFEGTSGTYVVGTGLPQLRFSKLNPVAVAPVTNWRISNANSFPVLFNYTLELNYLLLAENLTVSFQNSSAPLAGLFGDEVGADIEFAAELNSQLSNSNTTTISPNGQSLTRLELNVSSISKGNVQIVSLDIRYDFNLTTADLSGLLDAVLWSLPITQARASIPLLIHSPGASQLKLLRADITYDRPPEYFGFPANESPEDVPIVIDLNTVFHDDYDNANLFFDFNELSGSSVAFVALRGPYNLTITPRANASGTVTLNVTARDSSFLTNASGPITFTFLPVNDPPVLTVASINATWGQISTVDLSPYIVDAESATVTTQIVAVAGGPVTAVDRSLVFDFPANASDVDLTVTLSDGLAQAAYPLHVHPRQSDTVPELLPIPSLEIANNAAYWIDLRTYARDVEDPLAALHFELALTAGPTNALAWSFETNSTSTYLKLIPRGAPVTNVSTQLRVTDRDGNTAVQTIGVRIIPPPNVPPRIVGVPPTLAVTDAPYQLFLVTKFSDPEDGAQPASLTWEVSGANSDLFDIELNASTQVLTITPRPGASGIGSFTLTVRDSAGATDTRTIEVTVRAPPPASAAPYIALGLVFGGVVLFAAVFARRNRDTRPRPISKPLVTMEPEEPGSGLLTVQEAAPDDAPGLAALDSATPSELPESNAEVGDFLRGLTDAPESDEAGGPTVALGVKSGLDSAAAPVAAAEPAARHGVKTAGRLAELYLVSLKDGQNLSQVPPVGLPPLEQVEENEFLQWAFDTVRHSLKSPGAAKPFEWKGGKVVIARGNHFYIVGRARGEDMEALSREVGTLVAEVDHNFPGDIHHWETNEVVESVADVLRRLVK